MKKPIRINISFRWDQLSEEAKKNIEDCDRVLIESDPEYPEEVRKKEERIRKEMHRLNRLKRAKDN